MDDDIKLWDFVTGKEIWKVNVEYEKEGAEFGDRVELLAFSPNNKIAISLDDRGGLNVWDVSAGNRIDWIYPSTYGVHVQFAAFSPDSKFLYLNTDKGDILKLEIFSNFNL